MSHPVNNGYSSVLVFALCVSLILLLRDGRSEASVYHKKGKNHFCSSTVQDNVFTLPCAAQGLLLSTLINTCDLWKLWLLNQHKLADRKLSVLYKPDLAFIPLGALHSASVRSY